MKIPRFQECECGHLGQQHDPEDGHCNRCECKRFTHPSYRKPMGDGRPYRPRPLSPPTRDSGTR